MLVMLASSSLQHADTRTVASDEFAAEMFEDLRNAFVILLKDKRDTRGMRHRVQHVSTHCRTFEKCHFPACSQLFAFLRGHHSIVFLVDLVTDQNTCAAERCQRAVKKRCLTERVVIATRLTQLFEPHRTVFKRISIGDIVHDAIHVHRYPLHAEKSMVMPPY